MAGDDIPDGSSIDDEGRIRQQDGTADPYFRWVDEEGYIRLSDGSYDGEAYVDPDGVVYNASGAATGVELTIPADWSVGKAIRERVDAVQKRSIEERNKGLSETKVHPSSPDLAAFQQGIVKAKSRDAQGGSLTWAGDTDETSLHGRAIDPEYLGEEVGIGFAPNSKRGELGNDDWRTSYVGGESVEVATVSGGKLVDANGDPMTGSFGYVIHPETGDLYTFDQDENWVTKNGDWVRIGQGLPIDERLELVKQALKAGESALSVHHSTAVEGGPVAGAGVLEVKKGEITKINAHSGHYKPEAEYLWQSIGWLAAQGMAVKDIDVELIGSTRDPARVLKEWQFAQTGGNEAQIRLKDQLNKDIRVDYVQKETAREKAAKGATLVEGSLQKRHFEETGCPNLEAVNEMGVIYCRRCSEDLTAEYDPKRK